MEVAGADFDVVLGWVMLGEVVSIVVSRCAPLDDEVALFNSISDPEKRMSMALERRCLTVSLAMPTAALLSVMRSVSGCGCCISRRVWRMTSASLPLWKRPASSASAVLAMTF